MKPQRVKLRHLYLAGCSLSTLVSCNSFDAPPRAGSGLVRVAPTDERAPIESTIRTAPVMGSNLLTLRTKPNTLVVTDADRHRVSFVTDAVIVHVETGDDSRPNRAVEDEAGFVHVPLRGTGELVMLHPNGELVARSRVCQAPRGLDFDANTKEIVVACAEGQLVRHSADPANYVPLGSLELDADLRDVVVLDDRTYVSRMRSAEVLELRGTELVRHALPTVELDNSLVPSERAGSRLQPTVAWKMVATPERDGVIVLHQRSLLNTVEDVPASPDEPSDASGSPYGGSDPASGCSSIVQPAVSEVRNDGTVVTSDSIAGVVLAVDMLPQPRARIQTPELERSFVLAAAGVADPDAPQSQQLALNGAPVPVVAPSPFRDAELKRAGVVSGSMRLHRLEETNPRTGDVLVGCTVLSEAFVETSVGGPTVALTQTSTGQVAALQRGSSMLMRGQEAFFGSDEVVVLDGQDVADTGHDLFHRDSGGGIACASCHPEGEDDGHVWSFASVGDRRTQFLGAHLSHTAPFHWDGALPDLDVLMDEVFVARMGGVFQSKQRVAVLGNWLGNLSPTAKADLREQEAATRGQQLFESEEVGCSSCHSGEAFTNNQSHDVGTAGSKSLQTPSLLHVSLHPPFMHDGCAKTLRQRFEPSCGGGDAHGRTSHLSEAQIDDLVAYMKTL